MRGNGQGGAILTNEYAVTSRLAPTDAPPFSYRLQVMQMPVLRIGRHRRKQLFRSVHRMTLSWTGQARQRIEQVYQSRFFGGVL